jgi:hypothetical protein
MMQLLLKNGRRAARALCFEIRAMLTSSGFNHFVQCKPKKAGIRGSKSSFAKSEMGEIALNLESRFNRY